MKNFKFITVFFLLCLFSDLIAQQNKDWSISYEPKLEIGIEDADHGRSADTNYVFGRINDIVVDKDGNIFAADLGEYCVKKFDTTGRFIIRFGRKGQGPGEFLSLSDLAISESNQLYVCDTQNKRISIFATDGKFVQSFQITSMAMPARIAVDSRENIYVIGYLIYKGKVIKKYDRQGKLISEFCDWNEGARLAAMSGNVGGLTIDDFDNVYYSFSYPYKIQKYSPEGKLLGTISRQVSFFKPPSKATRDDKGRMIGGNQTAAVKGIYILPDEKIIATIWGKEEGSFLDVFSSGGKFLTSKPFQLKGKFCCFDVRWNCYFIQKEPYDKIIKFLFQLKQN